MQNESTTLQVSEHDNKVLIKAVCNIEDKDFLVPMTLIVETSSKFIKVEGSVNDGIYNPVNGRILIDIIPDKELVIEELKSLK